jgi:hypothetical protein
MSVTIAALTVDFAGVVPVDGAGALLAQPATKAIINTRIAAVPPYLSHFDLTEISLLCTDEPAIAPVRFHSRGESRSICVGVPCARETAII